VDRFDTWNRPEPHETMKVRGKTVKKDDFLTHIQTKKYAQQIHSDGFLAIESPPAYECPNCLFHGFFESKVCHRCGGQL
jgi:hypothetical protein